MKSYKAYLVESKKTYSFKLKVAGECPKDCTTKIKQALDQFDVESVSAGKATPIQSVQHEFPEHKNVEVTIFDVVTNYPATSKQVHDKISHVLGMSLSDIRVRNEAEEAEVDINHAHDEVTGEAIIGSDYEPANHQDLVGVKHAFSLLKDLGKTKHELEQRTGINDQLLAKSGPAYAKDSTVVPAVKTNSKIAVTSPVGTKPVKLSPVVTGVKNSLNVPKAKGKVK